MARCTPSAGRLKIGVPPGKKSPERSENSGEPGEVAGARSKMPRETSAAVWERTEISPGQSVRPRERSKNPGETSGQSRGFSAQPRDSSVQPREFSEISRRFSEISRNFFVFSSTFLGWDRDVSDCFSITCETFSEKVQKIPLFQCQSGLVEPLRLLSQTGGHNHNGPKGQKGQGSNYGRLRSQLGR